MQAENTIVVELSQFALIRFSGEEAQKFLHGQLSNSVEKLGAHQAQYTSYNSPKGRMMASMLLWRDADDYVLMLPASLREAIQKRLSMFVMRAKVKVSDATAEFACLGLAGNQAAQIADDTLQLKVDGVLQSAANDNACLIKLDTERYLLMLKPARGAVLEKIKARAITADADAWNLLDIRAGIAWISASTQEQFVAQMTNYELIGGVDFKKGCYPGQEIVARTQYLGKLKRRMYRVQVSGVDSLVAGDALFSADFDGQASGMIVNAAALPQGGFEALAVIQIDSAATQAMHAKSIDGPSLTLLSLPYALV